MKIKIKKVIAIVAIQLLLPVSVFATDYIFKVKNYLSGESVNITDLLGVIATKLIYLAIPVAVILIVYSGILLIYSRGDAGMVKKAKDILKYVVIGLAIIFINKGFIALIQSILDLGAKK